MRWPIQVQVLLSIVVVAAVALAMSVAASSYFAARQATQQQESSLRRVISTLTEAHFPLTDRVLQQMSGFSGAEFVLFGPENQVEASTIDIGQEEQQAIRRLPVETDFEYLSASPVVEIAGHSYLVRRVPLTGRPFAAKPGSLATLYRKDRWREAARQAAWPALVAGAVTAVAAVLVASALAQQFVRPLRLLGEQTMKLADDNFRHVTVPRRNDEIRDLAQCINSMTDKLSQYESEVRRNERLWTLGQLGAGIAHQLRNSATGARMDIELHQRTCPARDEEAPPLQVALRELRLMESYLQRFLSLGRAQPAAQHAVLLSDLVEDALEMVRPACAHNRVALEFQRPDEPLSVWGEAQALRELLVNLMLNALEAAARGAGDSPRVLVELRRRNAELVTLVVRDSGPGPSAETADRLFEPFVSEKPEGTGLGLFVSRQIAEAHRGSIRWNREDGMTCFEIEFPLTPDGTGHGASPGN